MVDGADSFLTSAVNSSAAGNSGGISIITDNLSVLNDATVTASTFGEGNSGPVEIVATGDIVVDGADSFLTSAVNSSAADNSGGISIITDNLSALNGAAVTTRTDNDGTAGVLSLQSNPNADLTIVLSEGVSINALTNSPEDGGDLIISSGGALTIQGPGKLTTESEVALSRPGFKTQG